MPADRFRAGQEKSGRTYRFREYTVAPDRRPDAQAWLFFFECRACENTGEERKSSDEALAWTLEHLKANPEHLSFVEHITRPYRATPGRWL